jgi:cytochrome d ubiquinol oxidase subunit I
VLRNGRAELVDFLDAVFNPSTGVRFLHTVDAALITGAFFAAGVSAWLLLKGRGVEVASRTLKIAVLVALVASVLEVMPFGDMHARQVANTQPEKLAAMEGLYETRDGAPLVLFGIPGEHGLSATVEIPKLLSLMTHGDPDARILGLDAFPEAERPPVALPFVSFHLMVVLGLLFIAVTGAGVFLLWRRRLFGTRWFLWLLVLCAPLPLVANEAGWVAAEVGRQPWIVYRLLKTADGISVTVPAEHILVSIGMFSVVAAALLALYLYLLAREVGHGPQGGA